jgi:hypothetical protein
MVKDMTSLYNNDISKQKNVGKLFFLAKIKKTLRKSQDFLSVFR